MNGICPVCGAPLTQMNLTLAATSVGTQCHRCWSHLHPARTVRPQHRAESPVRHAPVRASHLISRRAS